MTRSRWTMRRLATWFLLLSLAAATREAPAGPSGEQGPTHRVRVAGIVLKWLRANKEANDRRLEPLVRQAARQGAQIVCTTECFLDGYAIADKSIPLETYRALGEPIPGGKHLRRLQSLAKELNIHLVAGMLEADGARRYNTAVVIGPDGTLIGKYRKQRLGHEAVRNTPGDASPIFPTPYGRIGVMICADRRDPDVVRNICQAGADFLLCPSGGMFGPKSNDFHLQDRSRENGKYIVFVHPAEFLVTDPRGAIAKRLLLGDRLLIREDQAGKDEDQNEVVFFDLPLPPRKGRAPQTKRVQGSGFSTGNQRMSGKSEP